MRTLTDTILPVSTVRGHTLLRDALLVLSGSLLVALCAKVQLPMLPVPVTMQPFAVLLLGAALGSRRGALALVAYLLEGAAGLPVFAGPIGGMTYLLGPTAGYLFAFPLAALVVGALAERGWDRRFLTSVAALTLGQTIILAVGFCWLSVMVGAKAAFATGVLPFLVGDVLKIMLAAVALPTAWKLVRRLQ